jgi:hypothetical protein
VARLLLLALLGAVAAQEAEYGTAGNPIRCDGVKGERWYLSRLRSAEGERFSWTRDGSIGGGPDGHILDRYRNGADATLCLDLYHPRYIEIRAPKGYRLMTEWTDAYEYLDGKVHAFKDPKPFTGDIEEKREKDTLRATVKDGVVQGAWVRHYPDGKVLHKIEVEPSNRYHGAESWFRADGKPWSVYRYKDGVPHGKSEGRSLRRAGGPVGAPPGRSRRLQGPGRDRSGYASIE